MPILSDYKLKKYQYGIDIKKTRQICGLSDSKIHHGEWLSERTDPVIIKEMNEQIAERQAYYYLEFNDHNNIIRTIGYIENSSNLTIFIQEYAQHGDLLDLLMDNQIKISQSILIEIFTQIADAMVYVASKSIVK
jgi:serine/threonine protein kinase